MIPTGWTSSQERFCFQTFNASPNISKWPQGKGSCEYFESPTSPILIVLVFFMSLRQNTWENQPTGRKIYSDVWFQTCSFCLHCCGLWWEAKCYDREGMVELAISQWQGDKESTTGRDRHPNMLFKVTNPNNILTKPQFLKVLPFTVSDQLAARPWTWPFKYCRS